MSVRKFDYYEVENPRDFPSVELKDVKGFTRLADSVQADYIFHSAENADEASPSYFMLLIDRVLYRIKSYGYKTLDDMEDAAEKGYPTCEEYYEGRKGNYLSYKEHQDCLKMGSVDRVIYLKAQKLGFVDGFDEFKEKAQKTPKALPEGFNPDEYDSVIKLYTYASNNGFKDFGDFMKIIFLGFPSQDTYDLAKTKGFGFGEDYFAALKSGFDSPREYQEAVHLKIPNRFEYGKYLRLKNLSKGGILGYDQLILIEALKTYENGKKLSIAKLKDLLSESLKPYQTISDTKNKKCLPEWFTLKLSKTADYAQFLTNNEELKQFGIYDADGEYFQVSRMSDIKIYLDGSNVAFADENRSDKAKPYYRNIIIMADYIKNVLRYKEIIVIADASLRHRVADEHAFSSLRSMVKYIESPGQTSADEFLIQSAKKDKCFIVSNDTFRDWKAKDSWIFQNIDKIRIPFIRINDHFSLPALERLKQ